MLGRGTRMLRKIPDTLRAVSFDAVGTVFKPSFGTTEAVYGEYFTRLVTDVTCPEFRVYHPDPPDTPTPLGTAWLSAYQAQQAKFPNFGKVDGMDLRAWWYAVIINTFLQAGVSPEVANPQHHQFAIFMRELYDDYTGPKTLTLYSEAETVLRKLKEGGVKIGVLSDYDHRLEETLNNLGIGQLIDHVNVAYNTGVGTLVVITLCTFLRFYKAGPRGF
eukprot:TRINITY_DN24268_c0_g1_i1.p1 TRINITY_DN24268_c0_g1~~TRINITY_DN24268_c0_g1_i1.p1  ORF type:complete len:218 (-),score=7.56 TRINITY_DN24268_c0_g1_i1:334-987(-)